MTRPVHFFYDATMSEPGPIPQAQDLEQKVEEAAARSLDSLRPEEPAGAEHNAQRP